MQSTVCEKEEGTQDIPSNHKDVKEMVTLDIPSNHRDKTDGTSRIYE
jgi:hypothetical protein